MNITNSIFTSNLSHSNGGVISIMSRNDDDDDIQNSNNQLTLLNSTLSENSARYFGGVFYININNKNDYLFDINDNLFENNTAGVAGAVFFLSNNYQKYQPEEFMDYNKFYNNHANSHGDNFASNPSIIYYNDTNKLSNKPLKLISGNSINFNVQLYDEFNHLIDDKEKYYSNINFQVDLINSDNSTLNTKQYKILNNIIIIEHGKKYF